VLAEQQDVGPLARLDRRTNPAFSAWHKLDPRQGTARAKNFSVYRMKVQLKGKTARVWLNGTALFKGAKVTIGHERGAFCLTSAGRGNFFDNFIVHCRPIGSGED